MANQSQDVELRIRATNYSKQTTDKVVDALKEMTKAQDAQIESAKKGTTTTAQLEASYTKLENAAKALLSQQSLTKLYEAQSATLVDLNAKLEAARKAQQDFANSLTPGEERTKAQQAELNRLGKAVLSVEKQYERAQARVDATGQRLAAFGITASNLAESQKKIVDAVNLANAALEKQERAINTADADAARRKAQADAIAQRELQVRVDNQFAQAERDVAAALAAERAAQIAANQAAADKNRERQVEVDVLFAQAQRQATEELNKKTAALRAQQQALQAAADAAERMSRSSVVTARGNTPVLTPQLSQQIRDIQNPADAAVRSITGIEDAVGRLEARVTAIRGPVRDYRGALEDARRTQAALLAVAGQVDTYQNQIAALRAARYEYTQNRTAVNNLIAAMRAGNGGDDITTRLAAAQRTLQQSATALGNLMTAARQTQATLSAAGVNTAQLAQAEQQLIDQSNRATQALNSLNAAYRANGAAAEQSGSRILSFFGGDGGRTTLSYAQRLRGELLSLAAGFVGLNAAIELGKKTLEAYNQTQAVMNRLLVVNGGNAKAAASDYAYLQAATDRIGVSFTKVAPAYSKLAIAAKQAGMNTQQTRYIFEGFATATSKLGLSAVESERVFKAIEQMFNKGKVSAEELSQQLGDALPGAYNLFAKAANMTTQDFAKAMEQGQIAPSLLIKVAKELKDTYGAVGNGVENLSQSQARFDNAFNRFLNNTANGGFVKAYQQLLNKLSQMLNDGTADKFATQLSSAFVAVLNVLQFVIDHFDKFKLALEAVIAVKIGAWLFSLPAAFRAVQVEVVALQGSIVALQGWMARTEAAAAVTAALGTGGVAGVVARLTPLVMNLVRAFGLLGKATVVLAAGYAAYEATGAILDMMDNGIRERIVNATNAATKAFEDAAEARKRLDANTDKEQQAALKAQYDKLSRIAVDKAKEQSRLVAEAQAKDVNFDAKTNYAMMDQKRREKAALGGNSGDTPYPGDPDNSATALATLRKAMLADEKKSDRAMKEQRLRSAKEELDDRLAIIREPYQQQREEQKKLLTDEKAFQEGMRLIDSAEAKAVAAERAKFNNEQAAKNKQEGDKRVRLAMEIKDKLAAIEADIGAKNAKADPTKPYEERRAARIEKISHAYDELNTKILAESKVDPKQAALDRQRLEVLKQQRETLEGENSDRDEANRLAEEFNAKQTILQNRLNEIKTLYDSGKISSQQFLDQTNYAVATLGPGVEEAGQAALKFAASVKSVLDPVAYSNLVSSVRAGMAKSDVDATLAANNLADQQNTLNRILEQQQRDLDLIATKRKLGIIDSQQEADEMNANAAAYKDRITANVDELLRLLQTARDFGAISEDAFNKASAGAGKLKLETQNAHAASSDLDKTIVNSIATNGVTAFQSLAEQIAKVASGAESIGQGFRGALAAIGQFFAQFLMEIAQAILKQMILNALVKAMGASSGIGGAAAAAGGVAAAGAHRGGVMGQSRTFTRSVSADLFANAVRYHTGGIVGLRPNEMPAILEKNEEVLTRDDPRHVLNGGRAAAAPAEGGAGNRFVLVDDRARVPEAMSSSEGEKVTLVHLKKNIATLKQWLR
jgi:tape measure domain-containing protein